MSEAGCEPRCIALDFDGTLITEHVLTSWVLFLFRRSGWPATRRFSFLVKSVCRGAAAVMMARWSGGAPWAVRSAFGVFRGVEEKHLAALVHCRRKQAHTLNLNPVVAVLLKRLVESCRTPPEIRIYSQGSCGELIRQFLWRADVCECLMAMGICPGSVIILANCMETDGRGCFTGFIQGEPLTKFSRLRMMPEQTVFIGDAQDEGIFRRVRRRLGIRFINWRRWNGRTGARRGLPGGP